MKVLRWITRGLLAIAGILVVAMAAIYARTEWQARRIVAIPPRAQLVVSNDSATLARGKHVVTTMGGCADCHGADLGGNVLVDEPLVMRLAAPNLTTGKGGVLPKYDDAALEAAIRHGVAPGGRVLRFMPSHELSGLADDHVASIIAYLRALQPVDKAVPPMTVGPLARVLAVAGQLVLFPYDRIDHAKRPPAVAPVGATPEHGQYIAAGCIGCHGDGLSGGKIPGAPPDWPAAANITPTGIGAWSEVEFIRTIRTGVNPAGHALNPVMPWKQMAQMTDDELRALRMYLATVTPRPNGTR
ncbi:MAG: c-type cytochrome [Phycisphaerae bacterium]|nr:c-type cytochrome [Gemmatimonadaceae bacterium]